MSFVIYVDDHIAFQRTPGRDRNTAVKMVQDDSSRFLTKNGFNFPISSNNLEICDLMKGMHPFHDDPKTSITALEFHINEHGCIFVNTFTSVNNEPCLSSEQCPRGKNIRYVVGNECGERDSITAFLVAYKNRKTLEKQLDSLLLGSGSRWVWRSVKEIALEILLEKNEGDKNFAGMVAALLKHEKEKKSE